MGIFLQSLEISFRTSIWHSCNCYVSILLNSIHPNGVAAMEIKVENVFLGNSECDMLILYLMQHIPFEMRYENMDHTYFIDWPTSLPLRDMIYFVKLMTSYHILYQVALSHIAYSFGSNVSLPSSDTLLKEKKEGRRKFI